MSIRTHDKYNRTSNGEANGNFEEKGTSSAMPPKQLFSASKVEEETASETRSNLPVQAKKTEEDSHKDSDRVIALLSYSAFDKNVSDREEREILNILQNTASLDVTISEINAVNQLELLIKRVNRAINRRELLQLLGSQLNSENMSLVFLL